MGVFCYAGRSRYLRPIQIKLSIKQTMLFYQNWVRLYTFIGSYGLIPGNISVIR